MNQHSSSDQGYDPLTNFALPSGFGTQEQAREHVNVSTDALENRYQPANGYYSGDYQYSFQAPSPPRDVGPLPPFSHICPELAQNHGFPGHYVDQHSLPRVHGLAPAHSNNHPQPPLHAQTSNLFQMREQPRFLTTQHETTPHYPPYYNLNVENNSWLPPISQPLLPASANDNINPRPITCLAPPLNHTINWRQQASHSMPAHLEQDDAKPSVPFSRMRIKRVPYSDETQTKYSSAVPFDPSPSIPAESVSQSAVALPRIHPSVPPESHQREPDSHAKFSASLERGYAVSNNNLRVESNPRLSAKAEETLREPPEASHGGNRSPCTPKQSQQTEHAYMLRPLFPEDPKEIKDSPLPVPEKQKPTGMSLRSVQRKAQTKEETPLRRKSAPLHTGDLLSTVPLKTSKHAKPCVDQKRERKARSSTAKEGVRESKRTAPQDTQRIVNPQVTKSASRAGKVQKSPGILSRTRRKNVSMSLIVHSGDEHSSESSEGEEARQKNSIQQKRPQELRVRIDQDAKKRKRTSNKNVHDSDDDDFETDRKQCLSRDREKGRTNKGKTKHFREGSRKSPRLSKNIKGSPSDVHPLGLSGRAKETKRYARNSKTTKSLDELGDNEGASANGNHSDSSDDFEIMESDRRKEFDDKRKKWRESQQAKKGTPNSQRKRAKAKHNSQSTKRRRVSDKSNSEVESTDSRVDEPTSDSESPNASQRGSQPMEINFTSLSTKPRRRRKTDYSDERKRLNQEELSTIRLAFVKHYPPPPSNAQAQGRFEMRYGREMSQAMIQGLWENELKHWSDRWWEFYTQFNKVAREKKLQKPVDRKPTITAKEAEAWAQMFYEAHGDARLNPEARAEEKSVEHKSVKPEKPDEGVGERNTADPAVSTDPSKDHCTVRNAAFEALEGPQTTAVNPVAQYEGVRQSGNFSVVPAKEGSSYDNPLQFTAVPPAQSDFEAAQQASAADPGEQNKLQLTNEIIGPRAVS